MLPKDTKNIYWKAVNDDYLAGAMSTAELGISLAEMIRKGKVDIICCTGANL